MDRASLSPSDACKLPLDGVRILSLALNLPGPAALMRLQALGAHCTKLEAPAARGQASSDPMAAYQPHAYTAMHEGIERIEADLKSDTGQQQLHMLLQRSTLLLVSFRPAALQRLGLDWATLQTRYPQLSMVQIVGARGARANEAGHDLTYQAEAGLLPDLHMPASLLADMAGALLATQAALECLLAARTTGCGQFREIGLLDAAQWLALPRAWGLMAPDSAIGGGHAGYNLYPCRDGRVALAALEPHFEQRLWQQVAPAGAASPAPSMRHPASREAIAAFLARHTRMELDTLAQKHDIPLWTMP